MQSRALVLLSSLVLVGSSLPLHAQALLSLDGSRTGPVTPGSEDLYLGSPACADATALLQASGYAIDAVPGFDASTLQGADVLFTGLVDVDFDMTELLAIEQFVANGGGLIVLREWGSFYPAVDLLASVFGVNFDTAPSGAAGAMSLVHQVAAHPVWSGPAGSLISFPVERAGALSSGATAIGSHSADGRAALAALEYGHGRVLFLSDSAVFDSNSPVPPLPGTDSAVIVENMLAWVTGAIGQEYCIATSNSLNLGGVSLTAVGSSSVSRQNLKLVARPVPDGPAVFFSGSAVSLVPFGDGFLCCSGPYLRFPVSWALGQRAERRVDFTQHDGYLTPGRTLYLQCWYTDPQAGGSGVNLSRATELLLVP